MELYKAKYSEKKFDKHSKSNHNSRKYPKNNEPIPSYRNSRDETFSCRYSRDEKKSIMHTVTCDDCGYKCQIPFEPKFNRPVYCSKCFQKNKSQDSGDNYYRDEKSFLDHNYSDERSFRDYPDNYRINKSKSKKFRMKTENFYSNGSEKYYLSLKEKLFEILGGKSCSSCGFKEERALGFCHIYDDDAFDRIRRGGFASSWGKYISEPELAKKDLKVLCMNCNEIKQPQTKTKPEKSKIPNKKSRYFPR